MKQYIKYMKITIIILLIFILNNNIIIKENSITKIDYLAKQEQTYKIKYIISKDEIKETTCVVKYDKCTIKLKSASKEGYTFKGWYHDEDYNYYIGLNKEEVTINEDTTLYAKFVDDVAPDIQVETSYKDITNKRVNIKLNSASNDVAYYEIKVDDYTWIKTKESISLNDNGSHILKFRSIDKDGNISEEKELSINIDKVKPILTIKDNNLRGIDHNGINHYEYSLDNKTWLKIDDSFDYNKYSTEKVYYKAIDNAGNQSNILYTVLVK